MEVFPGVSINPDVQFRRPYLTGTRIDIATIVSAVAAGECVEATASTFDVTIAQVRAALAYAAHVAAQVPLSSASGLRTNALVDRSLVITTWKHFLEIEDSFEPTWMFRGHSGDWPLKSTLHRTCERFGKEYDQAYSIEYALRRDFSRVYDGDDAPLVRSDPMYCIAKMQHYGAPTRLLDWTYSLFVALYFAMESAAVGRDAFIWCMNYEWTRQKAERMGISNWKFRNVDETRGRADLFEDEMFVREHRMVFTEGALGLNSRLADQQGVFLLPGIVNESIDAILNAQLDERGVMRLLTLRFDTIEFTRVIGKLNRMRLTHRSVFADSSSIGRDIVMKIPALSIRLGRIERGELSNTGLKPLSIAPDGQPLLAECEANLGASHGSSE